MQTLRWGVFLSNYQTPLKNQRLQNSHGLATGAEGLKKNIRADGGVGVEAPAPPGSPCGRAVQSVLVRTNRGREGASEVHGTGRYPQALTPSSSSFPWPGLRSISYK